MRIYSSLSLVLAILFSSVFVSCDKPSTGAVEPQSQDTLSTAPIENSGVKIAFIYGDTINANFTFLKDVEVELEKERKLIDERIRRKLQRAEQRAGELQKMAQYMTQTEMQEAQLEMQNLEIELQQFEQKLATEFRDREIELQLEYVERVDEFLETYNADGNYDMILNFQMGGNLLWIKDKFDITADVLEGLNSAYAAELAEEETTTQE